ncbi:ComEC family competence protein, partial [Haemophilus influenzae]
LCNFFYLMAYR